MWLGQLPERVAVPGPGPEHQVAGYHPLVTFFPQFAAFLPRMDTDRGVNWAGSTAPTFSTSRCLHQRL